MTRLSLIVREDDTVACPDCYAEDVEDAAPFDLPQHRWAFAEVEQGECESCGVKL